MQGANGIDLSTDRGIDRDPGSRPDGTVAGDLVALEDLRRFEDGFDPLNPSLSAGVDIVGFGEISMVFKLKGHDDAVIKRMAGFRTRQETDGFARLVHDYVDLLAQCGIATNRTQVTALERRPGSLIVFVVQPAIPKEFIGNAFVRSAPDAAVEPFLHAILDRLLACVRRTRAAYGTIDVGLDAQVSNWAWVEAPGGGRELLYFDVGCPFLRRNGQDQIDWEPVLFRGIPLWVARTFRRTGIGRQICERYHTPRLVIVDILGNLIKEGCGNRLPAFLRMVNGWLAGAGRELSLPPIQEEEVWADYREDARFWAGVQNGKGLDRFVRRRILRQPYDFVVFPKIERGV